MTLLREVFVYILVRICSVVLELIDSQDFFGSRCLTLTWESMTLKTSSCHVDFVLINCKVKSNECEFKYSALLCPVSKAFGYGPSVQKNHSFTCHLHEP